LTFFQITEEDTGRCKWQQQSTLCGCGFIETVPAKKKKKCDSAMDEACGLLRAVNKLGKKLYLLRIWRICGE